MRAWLRSLLLGLTMLATPVHARPFTVDDLFDLSSVEAYAADPTGRWLVIQTSGPYSSTPSFDDFGYVELRTSRLLMADLTAPAPAKPLFAQEAEIGYAPGPFSPDGRRMVVFRRYGRSWDMGVATLESGDVRWWPITPELALYGRTVQWRSNSELLVIARPYDDLPRHLRFGSESMRDLPARWAKTASGGASVTAIGSGRFETVTDLPAVNTLLNVNASDGSATALVSGGFFDLELSPSGRYAALLEDLEPLPRPEHGAYSARTAPLRRRNLRLVDLTTGLATTPCQHCDLLTHLLTWSPRADRLLVFGRRPGEAWEDGRLILVEPGGLTRGLNPTGLRPVISVTGEGIPYVSADWLGGKPVVRAQSILPDGRIDWYRLTKAGPRNLTARFPTPPRQIAARDTAGLWFEAVDGVWGVAPAGHSVRFTQRAGISLLRAGTFGQGQRFDVNAPPPASAVAVIDRTQSEVRVSPGLDLLAPGSVSVTDPTETLEVVSPHGVVTRRRDVSGHDRFAFVGDDGRRTALLDINPQLQILDFATVSPVRHAGGAGQPVVGWLYLPAGHRPGVRLPLVVIPYPGDVYAAPPSSGDPGWFGPFPNIQVLAAQGYAVLVPSLPRAPGEEPTSGLTGQILDTVDTAIAGGDIDAKRVALWGHSFGGFAALVAATQTDRFKAIIASAGTSDMVSQWAGVDPARRFRPSDGVGGFGSMRWSESGQGAMAAPPWREPERYLRNSPLFAADKVSTPVLLIHGDQDENPIGQSEEMFYALWRQNKDAQLLIYWGEHHTPTSPSNLRDLYGRVFKWLRMTMPPT
ncbi:MAG: alpha/beta fold hydrolase [Phenylobacterium sp.]|uniref:S9 family peptidase n=2 Tax=Phenylobacterium sp. TaxID=1871053 RepID=UPI002722D156|nr:prolyl oligopeptidase family serine peptidase [Phenylobacterium sp.]MDO8912111.1 alpha/beta fold hydrolase [Phenylobacterium sp.]MDP3102966.1 alpha/beta fold hydrolase [Phenylobacterium sp.]